MIAVINEIRVVVFNSEGDNRNFFNDYGSFIFEDGVNLSINVNVLYFTDIKGILLQNFYKEVARAHIVFLDTHQNDNEIIEIAKEIKNINNDVFLFALMGWIEINGINKKIETEIHKIARPIHNHLEKKVMNAFCFLNDCKI